MATTRNQNAYKVGDIVQLKSGGPKMTVESPDNDFMSTGSLSGATIRCQWFAGSKLESGLFHPNSLVKVDESQGKDEARK